MASLGQGWREAASRRVQRPDGTERFPKQVESQPGGARRQGEKGCLRTVVTGGLDLSEPCDLSIFLQGVEAFP